MRACLTSRRQTALALMDVIEIRWDGAVAIAFSGTV
jgi:hypothetical protein